jgi:diguanylate cyclase (GGDEF)-like protein
VHARSFQLQQMASYLENTLRGQFAASQVQIFRSSDDDPLLLMPLRRRNGQEKLPSLQLPPGLREALLDLAGPLVLDGHVSPGDWTAAPEIQALQSQGYSVLFPLVHCVEGGSRVLHGLLCLGDRLARRPYDEDDLRLLQTFGRMTAICLHNELLYRRSTQDHLTRLSSRGYFEMQLHREIERVRRYGGGPLGLAMVDVDHFKQVNDKYGHPVGDEALLGIASHLRASVRASDEVARYGGEEFAAVLLNIAPEELCIAGERIRSVVADNGVETAAGCLPITVSVGLASFPRHCSNARELILRADEALYQAKKDGRNRIAVARERRTSSAAAKPPST